MKKTLLVSLILTLVLACGTNSDQNMVVTGNIKGLKKGTLYLQHIPDSAIVTLDSIEIDGNGNFHFETDVLSPEIFYLYLDKNDNNTVNDRITFFGEPGTVSINSAWNTFDLTAKITGSKSHEILEEYQKTMSEFNKRNLDILRMAMDPTIQKDSLKMDSIQVLSDKNMRRGYLYAINFALNNKDTYVAPYIAISDVADANPKLLDSVYSLLPDSIATSKYGKKLKELLGKE